VSGLALSIDCEGDQGFRLCVECEIPVSGITAVYGPSGSGKSTLLDCIAGLRRPVRGSRVCFRGEPWQQESEFLPPWQRRIGYVFQDARLFPHLSVRGNLHFAVSRSREHGLDPGAVYDWLELDQMLERRPESLSAGQKQRVAIARALLSSPRLLLLDEPLANLDHRASRHLLACLRRVAGELGLPMIYVSHDIEEVSQLADWLLLLDAGRISGEGPLLDLCSRLDTRLSHEEQAAAIALGVIRRHDPEFGLTELDVAGHSLVVNQLPGPPGQHHRVRIPARDVSVCREKPAGTSILNILPVTISEIEQSGDARTLLRLALGSQYLLARITRRSVTELGLKVGDRVYAQIKSAALLMQSRENR